MNVRATLILCVIAIVGVIAVVLVERGGSPTAAGGGVNGPLLAASAMPVDQITRITLKRRGEPARVFEATDDGWMQTAPFAHRMDASSMLQLGGVAASTRVIQVISPDALGDTLSRGTIGLDPPRAEVTYDWPGGSLGLRLGRRSIGGMAYLEVAGDDTVYVVNHDLHARASEMEPKEWRDRTIFRGVGIESDRIEIVRGATTTVLERDRKAWNMTTPVATRINPLALDALLQALGRARSSGFILDQPPDLASFGLANPVASVSVTTTHRRAVGDSIEREAETQQLLVGAPIGVASQDRFGLVAGRPVVLHLNQAVLSALMPRPEGLLARTASGVVPADVKSVRISTELADLTLERELEQWLAPERRHPSTLTESVEELLKILTSLQATDVAIETYPRELEVATITLQGYDGRPLDTVRVAREPGPAGTGGRWALDNGDGVLRIYPANMRLRLTASDFGLSAATASESD